MLDIISKVSRFNFEVVKIGARHLGPLARSEAKWLKSALEEEARELVEEDHNPTWMDGLVGQVDACGDAIIFALGGMVRAGLTDVQIHQVLHAIMDANFEKKAGVKEGRTGAADAVKPEGWVGPEARIRNILANG